MRPLLLRLLSVAIPWVIVVRRGWRRVRRPITLGVRAMIVQDGQVLLVRGHGSTRWTPPGGGMKRGESVREAAVREAREETGCRVEAERLLGLYLSVHDGMTNHVAVFVCRALSAPTSALNIEIAEARWWPLDALPDEVSHELPAMLEACAAGAVGLDRRW